MILGLFILLVALFISSISAYYSIIGLTAIFAGAVTQIIVMGIGLELGKLATVIWLHYNWERANWKLKLYLPAAVVILMGITSMGIFGGLSKAHLDQAVPTGNIQAQIELYDTKIATQQENIETANKAISQLDASVDQVLARSTSEVGAQRSANLRRSQAKERKTLQADVDVAQQEIAKLREEKAPIASQLRSVESDVGPIKYLAAVIYGDNPEQSLLESAVRMVIIIIVAVFDPLAIVLLLAATTSMDWSKIDRRRRQHEKIESKKAEVKEEAELDALRHPGPSPEVEELCRQLAETENEMTSLRKELNSKERLYHEQGSHIDDISKTVNNMSSTISELEVAIQTGLEREESAIQEIHQLASEHGTAVFENKTLKSYIDDLTRTIQEQESELKDMKVAVAEVFTPPDFAAPVTPFAPYVDDHAEEQVKEPEPVVEPEPVIEPEPVVEPEPIIEPEPVIEPEPAPVTVPEPIERRPARDLAAMDAALPAKRSMTMPTLSTSGKKLVPEGTSFPLSPNVNDAYLRIDYPLSRLYQWDGSGWREVQNIDSSRYALSDEYLELLVANLNSGVLEVDQINSFEQDQISNYLQGKA